MGWTYEISTPRLVIIYYHLAYTLVNRLSIDKPSEKNADLVQKSHEAP